MWCMREACVVHEGGMCGARGRHVWCMREACVVHEGGMCGA